MTAAAGSIIKKTLNADFANTIKFLRLLFISQSFGYYSAKTIKRANIFGLRGNFSPDPAMDTSIRIFCILTTCTVAILQNVEGGKMYTPLNKYYKVACIAEHLKVKCSIISYQKIEYYTPQ